MITEIGTLAVIVKNLLDAAKTGADLIGSQGRRRRAIVAEAQARFEGIAEQLHQSVALTKMLPIWLNDASRVDIWTEQLSDADVRLLDSDLRRLIADSIHDHFSGTFFRMSFAVLPGVDSGIEDFRGRLLALEQQLNGIPPGDAEAWRRTWPVLKVRVSDLLNEARKLDGVAEQVHGELIAELRSAARIDAE